MLARLLEQAARWFAENRDIIGGALTVAVYALAGAFQAVMVVVDAFAAVFRGAMQGDAGALGLVAGLLFLLLVLAKAVLFAVVPALWAMVVPIIAAAWPVYVIAAAVAAVTAGIILLIKHWDVVVAALQRGLMVVLNALADLAELFGKTLVFLGRGVIAAGQLLWLGLGMVWDRIARFARGVIDRLLGYLRQAGEGIRGVGRTISDSLVGLWDDFIAATRAKVDHLVELLRALGRRIRSLPGIRLLFDLAGANETPEGGPPQVGATALPTRQPPPPVTNVPPGYPAAPPPGTDRDRGSTSVSVGPTTVNLYGVKDATEAQNQFDDAVDGVHRHAAAALAGEVQ